MALAVGDLNGDGRPDVVAANYGSQNVSVFLDSVSTQRGPAYTMVAGTSSGQLVDGYIAGATVFADANGDGVWEPGEAKTTSDANGNFTLQNASGPLVATGGVDISTNLPFTGTLTAPSGYQVITPLTTLVNAMLPQTPTATEEQNAEQQVLTAMGITLGAGESLSSLDPVAGAEAGDAGAKAALIAGATVEDSIDLLTTALSAAEGSSTASTHAAVVQALAGAIAANPGAPLDLTSQTTLGGITAQAAETVDPTDSTPLSAPFISNVAKVVSNSNANLTQAATAASDPETAVASSQDTALGAIASALSDPASVSSTPAAPTIALAQDTGASSSDGVTNDGALTISGVETGATVQYSIDGGTTWTSSFAAQEGVNSVEVRQTDLAGNISPSSTPLRFHARHNSAGDRDIDRERSAGTSPANRFWNYRCGRRFTDDLPLRRGDAARHDKPRRQRRLEHHSRSPAANHEYPDRRGNRPRRQHWRKHVGCRRRRSHLDCRRGLDADG